MFKTSPFFSILSTVLLTLFLVSSHLFQTSWATRVWANRLTTTLGYDIEVQALGGVTAGLREDGSFAFDNPALAATQLRKMLGVNGGYTWNSAGVDIGLSYLHPTTYGVLGLGYQQYFSTSSGDFFFTLSPLFSKELTTFFSVGAKVNVDFYRNFKNLEEGKAITSFGVNADFSLAIRPEVSYQKGILAIDDLIVSLGVKNVGLLPSVSYSGNEKVPFKITELVRTGLGFDFLGAKMQNNSYWKLRWMTDVALAYPLNISYPATFSYHIGIDNAFYFSKQVDKFSFQLGYFYQPYAETSVPFTVGLTLDIPIKGTILGIKYAMMFVSSKEANLSLGFTWEFGDYDKKIPKIKTKIEEKQGLIKKGKIN